MAPRKNIPGVWCRKCGQYVTRLKHVKLKITGKYCPQANLPQAQWLNEEGFHRSEARLDQLEANLDSII